MKIETLIIHLERAKARNVNVQKLIEASPVEARVIPAVDGLTLSAAEKTAVYQPAQFRPKYPFALRDSEIACFLSHRKAWKSILDLDLEAALIVEDDVQLDPQVFKRAFELGVKNLKPEGYIRFPVSSREKVAVICAETADATLFKPVIAGLGMCAQLVHREAARALLDCTRTFDRPVDTTLQMTWQTGLHPLTVQPSGVSEISNAVGGSTIGVKKSLAERLERELLRPYYRVQLAHAARIKRA